MLAVLLSLFAVVTPQQKDSTLLYTLKENEVMVKQKEHKLMMTRTGSHYIFCIYRRGVGYFVFDNKTSYGPFLTSEPAHRYEPSYWIVGKSDGRYFLDALTGKMTGPFAVRDTYEEEEVAFDPFYVRAAVTEANSVNINGTIYKTKATGNDTLMITLSLLKYLPDGKVRVIYDVYGYKKKDWRNYYGADSVVMAAPANFAIPEQVVQTRRVTPESDSLFLRGNFVAISDRVENFFAGTGYQLDGTGELYHTKNTDGEIMVYRGLKPVLRRNEKTYDLYALRSANMVSFRDEDWNEYFVEADGSYLKETQPPEGEPSYKIVVLKKKRQWAAASNGKITFNNGTAYPGVDLGYNAKANCYEWLSVHGRSLYINTAHCE